MADPALDAFLRVADRPTGKHTLLIDLAMAGWIEMMPEPERWTFTHPSYPGVCVEVSWDLDGNRRVALREYRW